MDLELKVYDQLAVPTGRAPEEKQTDLTERMLVSGTKPLLTFAAFVSRQQRTLKKTQGRASHPFMQSGSSGLRFQESSSSIDSPAFSTIAWELSAQGWRGVPWDWLRLAAEAVLALGGKGKPGRFLISNNCEGRFMGRKLGQACEEKACTPDAVEQCLGTRIVSMPSLLQTATEHCFVTAKFILRYSEQPSFQKPNRYELSPKSAKLSAVLRAAPFRWTPYPGRFPRHARAHAAPNDTTPGTLDLFAGVCYHVILKLKETQVLHGMPRKSGH